MRWYTIKNAWISPTKIRLIKIKFEKAILFCDENEPIYKIKIYKKLKKIFIFINLMKFN